MVFTRSSYQASLAREGTTSKEDGFSTPKKSRSSIHVMEETEMTITPQKRTSSSRRRAGKGEGSVAGSRTKIQRTPWKEERNGDKEAHAGILSYSQQLPLKLIADVGGFKGQVFQMTMTQLKRDDEGEYILEEGVRFQLLAPVKPLVSKSTMLRALDMLNLQYLLPPQGGNRKQKGAGQGKHSKSSPANIQDVARLLHLRDPSTVEPFLRTWIDQEYEKKEMKAMESVFDLTLTKDEMLRATASKATSLSVPFLILSCGTYTYQCGDESHSGSIIPAELKGVRFPTSSAFLKRLSGGRAKQTPFLAEPTYGAALVETPQFMPVASIGEAICDAFGDVVQPSCVVYVQAQATTEGLDVDIFPFTDGVTSVKSKVTQGSVYKLLAGHTIYSGSLVNKEKLAAGFESAHVAVLVLDQLVYQAFFQSVSSSGLKEDPVSDEESLTDTSSSSFRILLSRMLKCLLRGRTLTSPLLLSRTIKDLFKCITSTGQPEERLTTVLWQVFCAVFRDVRPYVVSDPEVFSVHELLALGLLCRCAGFHCGPAFLTKLSNTILFLHQQDRWVDCLPWKGWQIKYNDKFFKEVHFENISASMRNEVLSQEARDRRELLNVLRFLISFDLPVNEEARKMFKRYFIGVSKDNAFHVPRFEPRKPVETHRYVSYDADLVLSAIDATVCPTLLLLVQASLPFPPSSSTQHSTKALGNLVSRLSTHLNVRTVKKHILGKETGDLFRMQQYLGSKQDESLASHGNTIDENASDSVAVAQLQKAACVNSIVNKTVHEKIINKVVISCQRYLGKSFYDKSSTSAVPHSDALENILEQWKRTDSQKARGKARSHQAKRRSPSAFESRTAFLQLFGVALYVRARGTMFRVILAGTEDKPFLIRAAQKKGGNRAASMSRAASGHDVDASNSAFLSSDDDLYREITVNAIQEFNASFSTRKLLPPPFGFRWKGQRKAVGQRELSADCSIETVGGTALRCSVSGTEVKLFDASALLECCEVPDKILALPPWLKERVCTTLYCVEVKKQNETGELDLLLELQSLNLAQQTTGLSENHVYDWVTFAKSSRIPAQVWGDILLKLCTRDGDKVLFVAQKHGIRRAAFNESLFEGSALRVFSLLAVLYPKTVRFDGATPHHMSFAVTSVTNAHYVHLMESLEYLSYGSTRKLIFDSIKQRGDANRSVQGAITTKLWPHQQEGVKRVEAGIREGKLGFADASTVGSGKTLTALAVIDRIWGLIENAAEPRKRSECSGCLILLPTNSLIVEWVTQLFSHSKGIHVIVQNAQGVLKSKGVSNAGAKPTRFDATSQSLSVSDAANDESLAPSFGPFTQISGRCAVITTLARARDHEFRVRRWDFVVIDECLSVQSPALNSVYAWKNVLKSTFGVLMLSATFFRSKLKSLFYMIRMLRSFLPKTESFLNTLLQEHIILYVPETSRSWNINYQAVSLLPADVAKYDKLLQRGALSVASYSSESRLKSVFSKLKALMKIVYEESQFIEGLNEEIKRLQGKGHRVICFARTMDEKARILKLVENAIDLKTFRKQERKAKDSILVLTCYEGAHGLNLQTYSAIITRPQPGDILEQMKGRIDRPGQARKQLELSVILAKGTIEEVEAANIRLCGNFFRQYLDPLSRTFQNRAMEAFFEGKQMTKGEKSKPRRQGATNSYNSQIATCYRAKLSEEPDAELVLNSSKRKPVMETGELVSSTEPLESSKSSSTTSLKVKSKKQQTGAKGPRVRKKKICPTVFISTLKPTALCERVLRQALEHLGRDPTLAVVIQQVGPPTSLLSQIGNVDPFTALCKSVVYQQLSVKAASSIFNRFQVLCGGEKSITPDVVLSLEFDKVRGCGFSGRKIEYVRSLATHFNKEKISRVSLQAMTDVEVRHSLIKVKGIGDWSIHMFLMFSLGRPDVFPVGDLVVRKACKRLYKLSSGDDAHDTKVTNLPGADELAPIAANWKPYRSVATWLLWHSVESEICNYAY